MTNEAKRDGEPCWVLRNTEEKTMKAHLATYGNERIALEVFLKPND